MSDDAPHILSLLKGDEPKEPSVPRREPIPSAPMSEQQPPVKPPEQSEQQPESKGDSDEMPPSLRGIPFTLMNKTQKRLYMRWAKRKSRKKSRTVRTKKALEARLSVFAKIQDRAAFIDKMRKELDPDMAANLRKRHDEICELATRMQAALDEGRATPELIEAAQTSHSLYGVNDWYGDDGGLGAYWQDRELLEHLSNSNTTKTLALYDWLSGLPGFLWHEFEERFLKPKSTAPPLDSAEFSGWTTISCSNCKSLPVAAPLKTVLAYKNSHIPFLCGHCRAEYQKTYAKKSWEVGETPGYYAALRRENGQKN